MILVTQGHQYGIGLEVFIKAFLCLSKGDQSNYKLFCNKDDLKKTLNSINISLSSLEKNLNIEFFPNSIRHNSTVAMELALDSISKEDILLTLPTSKDQIFLDDKMQSGHTEFFRNYYKNKNIPMTFMGPDTNFLLLSDHISTDEISNYITEDLIIEKVSTLIAEYPKTRNLNEVFFSGINPHVGEGGVISSKDEVIFSAVKKLEKKFPNIEFHEPLAGDTLHFKIKNKHQLFVYAFHDQGLAPFKLKYGLIGINLTLGLPFKRVSVDHGTAFEMYGKNSANYQGMLFLMNEIHSWI